MIVKQSLVSSEDLTGKMHSCMMVDRTTLQLPEAKVSLDTPYFKGDTFALCMENPLIDVIIGNIPGARDAHDPNMNWVPGLAVQLGPKPNNLSKPKPHSKPPIFHLNKLRKLKLMILLWQKFEKLAKNQKLKVMLSFFARMT